MSTEVWLSAGCCDSSRGTTLAWLFMMTHRRAVDVVRREQSCRERDSRHHRETSRLGQDYTDELVLRRLQDEEPLYNKCPAVGSDCFGILWRAEICGRCPAPGPERFGGEVPHPRRLVTCASPWALPAGISTLRAI